MSAVDRMGVRVRGGGYRSLPRRQALALIAAGRAEADRRTRVPEQAPNPYDLGTFAAASGELDVDDSAASADDSPWDGSWQAERGPIVYNTPTSVEVDGIEQYPTLTPMPPTVEIDTAPVTADLLRIATGIDPANLPPEPKPSALRGVWAEYAGSLGVEVTSEMTKRQIQEAAKEAAQSLSNLPQPALPGGRLETPEDEPATETVANDPDTRTR